MRDLYAKPIRWAALWLLTLIAAGLGSLFSSGITSPLFAYAFAEEQDTDEAYEQDGTKIESLTIKWLTSSSEKDNEGNTYDQTDLNHLFLATASDTPLSMQFQVNVSLSGQHNYAPRELKIIVPAQIWHPRQTNEDGKMLGVKDENALIGGMSFPMPPAPATQNGYNWTLVGNNYIITNTQTLSAATQISFRFTINGIVPHMIVDRDKAKFSVTCEVKTAQGNTLTRESNELTAEIDTIEKLEEKKAAKSGTVYEGRPSAVTDAMLEAGRIQAADGYIYVQWMTHIRHKGNQPFSLSMKDSLSGVVELSDNATDKEKPISGILLGGKVNDRVLSAAELQNENGVIIFDGDYCTPKNYDHLVTVWAAYPKESLPAAKGADDKPVSYTLRNTADWTLTELDPAVDGDEQKITTERAEGKVVYTPVVWQEPTIPPQGAGSFTHTKKNKDVSDYGYALNRLLSGNSGDNSVEHTYLLSISGYGYPYTKTVGEADGPEAYGWNAWSQSVTDENLTLDDEILSAEDYEFTQVVIGVPNVSAWERLFGGGYGYLMDSTLHKPALTIEYKTEDGGWNVAAVAHWGSDGKGTFGFDQVESGFTPDDTARKLSFPVGSGVTGLRASYTSNVFNGTTPTEGRCDTAAVSWVITPTVRIKPSAKNQAIAAEHSRTGTSATLKNKSAMEASQGNRPLAYSESTAATTLSSARYGVALSKKLDKPVNDIENRVIRLRYRATMSLQTNLRDLDEYNEAVQKGAVPEQKRGIWYDLLPPGVTPILNTVQLRSGDAVTGVYTVRNYRNTGRVLLVVEASLTPTPVYSSTNLGGQVQGYADKPTLSFEALYPWTAYLEIGNTLRNDVAFESLAELPAQSSGVILGTIQGYQGEPDNPRAGMNRLHAKLFDLDDPQELQYAMAMTDLDSGSDEGRFVYAKSVDAISADTHATSGLNKLVASPVTGEWTGGLDSQTQATVTEGEIYTYRLRVNSLEQGIGDIVIYDSLECFVPSEQVENQKADAEGIEAKKSWSGKWNGKGQWRGTLVSVDMSDLLAHGIRPVLYYATQENLTFEELDSGATQEEIERVVRSGSYLLTDTSIWTKAEAGEDGVFTVPVGVNVTAIAVDARYMEDDSPFELKDNNAIQIYLNMRAPEGDAAENAYCRDAAGSVDWTGALDPAKNMYAFNNARYVSKTNGMLQLSRNDYTRVGIVPCFYQVTKKWNDQNNHDGMRPQSVRVTLMRKTMGSSKQPEAVLLDGSPWTIDLSEGNSWTGLFRPLPPRDEYGNPYIYSVQEEEVTGYTGSITVGERGQYTLTNTHPNELVTISGQKLWADDGNAAGVRPANVKLTLWRDDKAYKTITVTSDANGDWRYSFGNLDKYAPYTAGSDGPRAYDYAVTEEYVPKYVYEVSADGYSSITNTYTPTGSLSIAKTLDAGATEEARKKDFTFVVTLTREQTQAQIEAGEQPEPLTGEFPYTVYDKGSDTVVREGMIVCGGRLPLKGGQFAVITGIPSESGYEVSEEPLSGFTCTGMTGETGVIRAGETAQASFVNSYSAGVSVPLYVKKTLTGGVIGEGQFRFELWQNGEVVSTATTGAGDVKTGASGITSEATAAFGRLNFTQADDQKTFTYTVREVDDGQPGYTYDPDTKEVTITLRDMGDGTMDYDLVEDGKPLDKSEGLATFENIYEAEGFFTLRAWKEMHGRALRENEFTFALYDYSNGTIGGLLSTAHNNAEGGVVFPALGFTQNSLSVIPSVPRTYTYLMCELPGSDKTVAYSDEAYLVTLTVTDEGKGQLNIEQTAMKKAAVLFENGSPKKVFAYAFCVTCGGTGVLSSSCAACKGTGKVTSAGAQADCATCGGTGRDKYWTCTFCGGTGHVASDASNARPYSGAPVFSNELKPGNLSVQKKTTSDEASDQVFRFHLKLTGESIPVTLLTSDGRALTAVDVQQSPAAAVSLALAEEDAQGAQSALPAVQSLLRAAPAPQAEGEGGGAAPKADDPEEEDDEEAGDGSALLAAGINLLGENDLQGDAYARLDITTGEMVFFRSADNKDYEGKAMPTSWSSNRGEASDSKYIYYKGFENTKIAGGGSWPWNSDREKVYSVVFNGVIRPKSCWAMFYNMKNLTSADVMKLDTSIAVSMKNMFNGCNKLESLNLSSFSTSLVSEMQNMFYDCKKLKSLTLSESFNTSSVTTMEYMFKGCSVLESLDLSSFNTGNVKTMQSMFSGCKELKSLTLSESFDTSSVTTMKTMFNDCNALESLDLRSFSTGNVTDMEQMFINCKNLKSLTISESFDTSKVTTMLKMFYGCAMLESLDLSSFNTSQVGTMVSMFEGCSKLKSIELGPSFDTSSVTNMYRMFWGCKLLTSLDLSSFNTSNVTSMATMFYECNSLTSLNLRSFDTRNVSQMQNMFFNCKSLTSLDLSSFSTKNVSDFSNMFLGCENLQTLNIGGFSIEQNSNQIQMFNGCKNISRITISRDTVMNSTAQNNYPNKGSKKDWVNVATGTDMDGDKLFTTSFDKNGTWVWYVPGYSLLFDANGGYSTMGRQTGLEVEKNHTIDTKDRVVNRGYALTGFTATVLGKDYTFPVQEDGTVVIPAEDNKDWDGLEVTLYAQWERNAGEPVMESHEFVFDLQAGKTIQLMNLPGGAAYEVWEESTPGWTLQSFEKLNGTIASNDTIQAEAINEKTPNKVSYILRASKTMDGRPAREGEFSFMLTETTGETRHKLFTEGTNAGGSVLFDAIVKEYASDYWTDEREPEVYTYEIQEIDRGEPTIDYDPNVYIATVTVSKRGTGLNAEVTYARKGDEGNASETPPTFANATRPGKLVIEKAAANPLDWTEKADAQRFTFDVMMTDSVGNPINGTFALETEGDSVIDPEPTITLTRGQGTVILKKGQKATIFGLPAGTLYTVTEREKPGFTATVTDATPGEATVTDATPGEATGAITAAQDSTATFMNSYAAKGVAVIKAKKALEGRDLAEGEFEFELLQQKEGQPDTPVETATNAEDGTVLFKTLEYTKEGTYRYVIREVKKTDPAIDYSGQELAVTVVMTDREGEGRLTPRVTFTGGDGEQHDTITNRVLKGALKISKTVEPESARNGEAFTFTVTLRDASGNPLTGDYSAVRETGKPITLSFSTAGVCTLPLAHGQSVTIRDLPGGATYAVEEAARAGYAVSSTGESGTIVGNSTAEASFTNTYSAKGSYTFMARKILTGGELTAGQFRFMLEELNDEDEPTGKSWKAANGANGANDSVALATLDFTDEDLGPDGTLTRRYRVTEINESAAGYVYDDTVYTVELKVSDAEKDGALEFSAVFLDGNTPKEAAVFANSYSNSITMTAQKVWQDDGDAAQNTRRDVTLTLNRRVDNGAWTPVEGSERIIRASDTGDRLKVTWKDFPRFDDGKIIEYQVVETMAEYTPQTNPYRSTVTGTAETGFTVTNRYVHTELTLEGGKTLSGLALSKAPEFHFVLMKDGAELETVTNDTDGKFRFSPLVYTLADLYEVNAGPDGTRSRTFDYTVSERNDGQPGYKYDPSVYSVTVTLTEDVNGVLSARVTGITKGNADAQKLEFANTYEAEGKCTLAVRKVLTGGEIAGRKLKDGEFTFNLYEAGDDGEPVGTPIQAKNNVNGSVTFEPITYTKEGTYRYVISEAEGSDDTIVYSKQQIYVTVDVSDPRRDGKLDAAANYADRNGAELTSLTNTVKPGSLVIKKEVLQKGEMTEQAKNQLFAFEVTLTAGQTPWSGQRVIVGGETKTTDAQGRLLVHAMGGKDVRISGIPAGISYAIRETDQAEGWQQVDAQNTSNSIQANRTAEASFTNEFVNLIDITAIKVWQGDEGNEQLRRDIELRLLRRAGTGEWEQLSTIPISKDAQTEAERKVTWTTLPRFDKNGDAIEYRVDEAQTDTADGSSPYLCQVTGSMAEGFTVTNSFCRTAFTVYKQWRGADGGPISLTLYADGERLDPQPVCRRVGNVYTYEDLMMYNRQGLPIVYSAKEAYMEGYLTIYCNKWPYDQESRMIYNGGTIVNREVVDVRVQKVWLGLSPEVEKPQITLTLLCNGEPVDRDTPVPDRNGWYCFTNLPVYTADGTRAEYTVVEAPMSSCVTTYTAPDGSPADCAKNGYTITNRCLPETGDTTHEAGWLALGMGAALGALLLALRRRRASPDDR